LFDFLPDPPMMTMTAALFTLGVTVAAFAACWLLSLATKNAGLVDIYWGPGFFVIALAAAYAAQAFDEPRGWLILAMTGLWGLRLGLHLGIRNLGHLGTEDARYAAMREKRPGSFWLWSLFMIFLLQAVIMWLVSAPIQIALFQGAEIAPFTLFDGLGLAVFAVGLVFETVGDWQLAAFKAKPENTGKVMNRGLWAWTRHPNYFGDFLVWWGFALVALSVPYGWIGIFGAALMSFFLLRVSGVPLMEKGLAERKPDYADYVARTSPFFPWPPKRG